MALCRSFSLLLIIMCIHEGIPDDRQEFTGSSQGPKVHVTTICRELLGPWETTTCSFSPFVLFPTLLGEHIFFYEAYANNSTPSTSVGGLLIF